MHPSNVATPSRRVAILDPVPVRTGAGSTGRGGRSAALLAILLIAGALSLRASVFLVYNGADLEDVHPGDGICDADADPNGVTCTLRAAVSEANALPGPDIISFLPLTAAVTAGHIEVTGELLIIGQAGVVIDSDGSDNIFDVQSGAILELRDLELRDGVDLAGGCIRSAGDLILLRVEIHDCTAFDRLGTPGGGGVFVWGGDLVVLDSWIHDNDANDGVGGGISAGDGVHIEGTTLSGNTAFRGGGAVIRQGLILNSTVYGNTTTGGGGGLWLVGDPAAGAVYNSTIVANDADTSNSGASGGGILATTNAWSFRNTVIAGNSTGFITTQAQDCSGRITSQGYNFLGFDDGACSGFGAIGDQMGVGALLQPHLLLEGGGVLPPSFTPRVEPLSPLIDAGEPGGCQADLDGPAGPAGITLLFMDQRFTSRIGSGCDIGAVESGLIFLDGFESGDVTAW